MRVERRIPGLALMLAVGVVAALPPELAEQFSRLPEALQQQVRAREARLAAMPTAGQALLQRRRAHWDALPATERAMLREHWQAWRSLPADQQQSLREAASAFAALPLERQRELRLEFAQLSVDEQRGWLLGPRVGAAWPQLQPLLMQVPGNERDALLAALQAMPEAQLRDLAILAQRTPPQEREALRRGLMQTTDLNRAAWLELRLER